MENPLYERVPRAAAWTNLMRRCCRSAEKATSLTLRTVNEGNLDGLEAKSYTCNRVIGWLLAHGTPLTVRKLT
jgi:hypothetical protein